jgi:predicted small lipoprotein YifL
MSAHRTIAAFAAVLLAIALTGTLGGCGQKGALYLPQQKKAKVPANPINPAPAPSPQS